MLIKDCWFIFQYAAVVCVVKLWAENIPRIPILIIQGTGNNALGGRNGR